MNYLVKIKKGEILTSSLLISKKFGKQHAYVYRKIKGLIKEIDNIKGIEKFSLKFIKSKDSYRNQEFDIFLMNKQAFSLLCMQFSGNKAREWQIKFNDAFYKMEKHILQEQTNKDNALWVEQRKQGKLARKEETDIIKMFVEYATKQGSKKAQFYYKHFTMATYRALQLVQHNKPKVRDTLDTMQTSQLIVAENIAGKKILKYMQDGEHYKSIFTLVKRDLEAYADSLFLDFKTQEAINE